MAHLKFVNLWQSKEERQAKYWLCRSCGASDDQARRQRDWRLAKIERLYHLKETYNEHTHTYDRELNIAGCVSPVLDREPVT
ncbi:unnamed protein product [marine sediment metagenome]|uniref:Uncharacterized protein n=1 Tax=marine sediment metagenome TaxID=412755 RepID=X1RD18_9ZZZZ